MSEKERDLSEEELEEAAGGLRARRVEESLRQPNPVVVDPASQFGPPPDSGDGA